MSNTIAIENTTFIFKSNFSGDMSNDRFGDSRRKCNIVIPDAMLADMLERDGFVVRQTRPRQGDDMEDFEPERFVTAILKYRTKTGIPVKYPPKVYLVSGDSVPVLLDEESVGCLDNIRVKNVNVVLNTYTYDPANGGKNLYVRTMYVEQDLEDDPYAARYRWNN